MSVLSTRGLKVFKFIKRLLTAHNLLLAIPSIVGLAMLGGVWLYPKPVDHKQPLSGPVVIKPEVTVHSSGGSVAPQVSTITSTPSSIPEAAPIPTIQKTTSPPVIKPAPSSSVVGLTPASPSSNNNNDSGGNSSGSDTSGNNSSGNSLPAASGGYESSNWAGYLSINASYTGVSADWTADSPSGNGSSTSADGAWIGIGGVTSDDLLQVGVNNTVSPSGQVNTEAFYEMLPASSVNISSLSVRPGDSISASLSETSTNEWTILINDLTSRGSFTTNVSYDASDSSAEWIEEDPETSFDHLLPLDNFNQVNFTDCLTTVGVSSENLSQSSAEPITMVNAESQPVATPSVLASDFTDFNVYDDND